MRQFKTALIAGATGAVGKTLLYQLLEDENYAKVIAVTRKNLPLKHPKLEQVLVEFDHLEKVAQQLIADDVFCCLGTTIKIAGSKAAFTKVDFDYPLSIAEITKAQGAHQFVLVSALGAKAASAVFYNQVKGKAEDSIKQIGFDTFIVVRPSLLITKRTSLRLGEKIAQVVMSATGFLMIGPLKMYKAIKVEQVAKAMLVFANKKLKGHHVFLNDQLLL